MLENEQPKIEDLLAVLPEWKEQHDCGYSDNASEINDVIPMLSHAAGQCPACMLAAIRQKGIPVPAVESFNFKAKCDAIWADINDANRHEDY